MADQIFGELRYEDDYGWWGKHTLEFGGNLHTVDIMRKYDSATVRMTRRKLQNGGLKLRQKKHFYRQ